MRVVAGDDARRLASAINRRRADLRLSVRQIGISPETLKAWDRGGSARADAVEKVARVLGWTVDYAYRLARDAEGRLPLNPAAPSDVPPDERDLLGQVTYLRDGIVMRGDEIPEDVRGRLFELMRAAIKLVDEGAD